MGHPWLLWVLIVLLPNNGIFPSLKPSGQKLDDFYFLEQEDPEEVLRITIQLVKDRIPKWFGLDAHDDIQVLTPMHKGAVGAGNLNVELQKVLNPGEVGVTRGGRNSNYLKLFHLLANQS